MSGRFVPPQLWAQLDRRRRLFRPGARCSECGVADTVVLVLGSDPLCCHRCRLRRRTGLTSEGHHLGGRPSPLLVEVDANTHRWLTLYQSIWRGRFAPGSPEAVLVDVLTLFAVGLEERQRGQAT